MRVTNILSHPTHDGETIAEIWDLISLETRMRHWKLSWHRHAQGCRYGLYTNLKVRYGLFACLNIPMLGDFSIWRFLR